MKYRQEVSSQQLTKTEAVKQREGNWKLIPGFKVHIASRIKVIIYRNREVKRRNFIEKKNAKP